MKQNNAQHAWGSNHPFHPTQNITTIWNTQSSFPVFLCKGLMSSVSQGTLEGSIPIIYSTPVVKIQTHQVGGQSSNSYFGSAGMALWSASSTPNSVFQEVCLFVISSSASVPLCSTSLNIHWCSNSKPNGLGSQQAITHVFSHVRIHI